MFSQIGMIILTAVLSVGDDFSANVHKLYYSDGYNRVIDYDFVNGTADQLGKINLPGGSFSGTGSTVPAWEPQHFDEQGSKGNGFYKISLPQVVTVLPEIPIAEIAVDESAADWENVPPYCVDRINDSLSPEISGSDIEYFKLAYSPDGSRINFLIKLTSPSSECTESVDFTLSFEKNLGSRPGDTGIYFYHNCIWWYTKGYVVGSDYYRNEVEVNPAISVFDNYIEGSADAAPLGLPLPVNVTLDTYKSKQLDTAKHPYLCASGGANVSIDGVLPESNSWCIKAKISEIQNVAAVDNVYEIKFGLTNGNFNGPAVSVLFSKYDQDHTALTINSVYQDCYSYWQGSNPVLLPDCDPAAASFDFMLSTNDGRTLNFFYKMNASETAEWISLDSYTPPIGNSTTINGFPYFTPAVTLLAGYSYNVLDINMDTKLDFKDFAAFASAWLTNQSSANYVQAFDNTEPLGVIDISDLAYFAGYWLNP
jgi:hypothetical protein